MSDKHAYNLAFYKDGWRSVPLVAARNWPEHTALAPYLDGDVLEVGPGMFPRSDAPGTIYLEPETTTAARLRSHGRDARVGRLEALPFADDAFDTVLALDVLEHVDDDTRALAEVARVLRPGGHLALSVPLNAAYWSALDALVGHTFRYDATVVLAKLADVGLVPECGHIYRPTHPSLKRLGDQLLLRVTRGFGVERAMAWKAWWIQRASWLTPDLRLQPWPDDVPADASSMFLVAISRKLPSRTMDPEA